jgi:hypothetical protein
MKDEEEEKKSINLYICLGGCLTCAYTEKSLKGYINIVNRNYLKGEWMGSFSIFSIPFCNFRVFFKLYMDFIIKCIFENKRLKANW